MIRMLLLVSLLLIQVNANALTSHELVEKCKVALEQLPDSESKETAVKRFLDVGTCGGYIGGVVAGVNLVGAMLVQQKAIEKNFICTPERLHAQKLMKTLINYVDKNKKLKKEAAQLVIYKMLVEKFPCSKK